MPGTWRLLERGVSQFQYLYFVFCSCFSFALLAVKNQKTKKISFLHLVVIFELPVAYFRSAKISNPENTKLCDFTSTNNNDFICTPIAPSASKAGFFKIKPALLNLVMKEQFSGVSTDAQLLT